MQPDVPAGRVEGAARARFGVQDPHDQVAGGPDAVDQAGDVVGDVGIGDGLPQRPLAERFLDVDDDESASHVLKHPRPSGRRERQDQVPLRTDPVTRSGDPRPIIEGGSTSAELR